MFSHLFHFIFIKLLVIPPQLISRHPGSHQPAFGSHCLGPLASAVLGGGLLKYRFLGLPPEGPRNPHFSWCHGAGEVFCLFENDVFGNTEVFALETIH